MTTPVLPTHKSRRRTTKGNNGSSRQRQLLRRLMVVIAVCCFIIGFNSLFGGGDVGGTEDGNVDESAGSVVRTALKKRSRNQNRDNRRFTNEERAKMILSGEVHLVDIKVSRGGLQGDEYEGVMGRFCTLDWSIHKDDPSSTPMFRDLVAKSGCSDGESTFTYDLKHIVKQAIEYDKTHDDVRAMEPAAFVFHESRCGSTLVANTLAAMEPAQHRVYSESSPPIAAIKACGLGGKDCPPHRAAELVQDVMYMMGRTNDPEEERLFFKIQSIGTKYADVVTEAFPETPWIYVYRDPVQVMMSQLAHGENHANCVHQLSDVPQEKRDFLRSIDRSLNDLSAVERCALHLSTLCDKAVNELEKSNSLGTAVNYENLVQTLMDDIFPNKFDIPMTDKKRERIIAISGNYSKGRGKKKKQWKEDSNMKDQNASPEIKEASETFLYPSYEQLEGHRE